MILLIERLFLGRILKKLPVLNHLYAILLIAYGWVIFRCGSVGEIWELTKALFGAYGLQGNGTQPAVTLLSLAGVGVIAAVVFVIALVASTPILPKVRELLSHKPRLARVAAVAGDVALFALFFLSVVELALGSYNPFIYFKF